MAWSVWNEDALLVKKGPWQHLLQGKQEDSVGRENRGSPVKVLITVQHPGLRC